jgi:hypothetical protein
MAGNELSVRRPSDSHAERATLPADEPIMGCHSLACVAVPERVYRRFVDASSFTTGDIGFGQPVRLPVNTLAW